MPSSTWRPEQGRTTSKQNGISQNRTDLERDSVPRRGPPPELVLRFPRRRYGLAHCLATKGIGTPFLVSGGRCRRSVPRAIPRTAELPLGINPPLPYKRPFDNNTLLMAGDIERNPGPAPQTLPKWKCSKCGRAVIPKSGYA